MFQAFENSDEENIFNQDYPLDKLRNDTQYENSVRIHMSK